MVKDIISFRVRQDFGYEYYTQILNFGNHFPKPLKGRSILQLSVSYDDYRSWPYGQITFGSNSIFGVLLAVHRFSFALDLLGYEWCWDAHDKALQEEHYDKQQYPDPW